MKRILQYIFPLVSVMLTAASCSRQEEPDFNREVQTSVLVYAVASNNLEDNLADDKAEMLRAAENIDFSVSDVLVYSVTKSGEPKLQRIVPVSISGKTGKSANGNTTSNESSGAYTFETIKSYTRDTFSTDPSRISEVIGDFNAYSKASTKGLVFWSHATGWLPDFPDHAVPSGEGNRFYSYGRDEYRGVADSTDILELAEAIPDDTFDYIWFDCCLMSSVEVCYQLRNKANYIVAYPSEVMAEGMPYDLTLPLMVKPAPRLTLAADAFADYFKTKNEIFTIACIDTSVLPEVAQCARKAVSGKRLPMIQLQKYTRGYMNGFYDLGQYTRTWGQNGATDWDGDAFEDALTKLVLYKSASSTGFDNKPVKKENFSGISTAYYENDGTKRSEYYRRLDWYRDVYDNM